MDDSEPDLGGDDNDELMEEKIGFALDLVLGKRRDQREAGLREEPLDPFDSSYGQ